MRIVRQTVFRNPAASTAGSRMRYVHGYRGRCRGNSRFCIKLRMALLLLNLLLIPYPLFAWNSLGHLLVAQIAADQLDPQTKRLFRCDNRKLNRQNKHYNLLFSSLWMDDMRYQFAYQGSIRHRPSCKMHYIDIPYAQGTKARPPSSVNAVSAI